MTREHQRNATTACLGYRRKWVDILTAQLSDGPPAQDAPQLRYVSTGQWEARVWTAKGPVTFTGPSPKRVMECVE